MPNIAEIIYETFYKLIDQSSTFISNFLSAILILLIGWLVAKGVSYLLKSFLSKVGIDKLGDKVLELDVFKKYKLELKLSKVIAQVVYVLILLFIAVSAADTLGVPAISAMFLMLVNFIPKLAVAIFMILAGIYISDLVRKFAEALMKSFNIPTYKLIGKIIFFFFSFIAVILALGQAGINTKLLESSFSIIIAAFALAFAIGFGYASKDVLINVLSSVYSKNKIKEGDLVEIEGVKGVVHKLDSTNVTIKTNDNKVLFPIKVLQSQKIIIYK